MLALNESHRTAVLDYIAQDPEMNLFFFGDIENYGVDKDPVHVFAQPGADGWDCLLLQYFDSWSLYSRTGAFDAAAAAQFLKQQGARSLAGMDRQVAQLCPYFPEKHLETTYLCRCTGVRPDALRPLPAGSTLRRLEASDLPARIRLAMGIEEFADSFRRENAYEFSLRQAQAEYAHGARDFGVFEGDELVAVASTSADNSQSAMVVGVAARPDRRGRGYASAAVAALCTDVLRSGRFLCLFYDNPAAGRIYHRLSFEDVGLYGILQ